MTSPTPSHPSDERLRDALARVERALDRVETGLYGHAEAHDRLAQREERLRGVVADTIRELDRLIADAPAPAVG